MTIVPRVAEKQFRISLLSITTWPEINGIGLAIRRYDADQNLCSRRTL